MTTLLISLLAVVVVIVIVAGIGAVVVVAIARDDYGLGLLYGNRDGRRHAVAGPAEGAPKPMIACANLVGVK
jgi:hypothetical protein